MGAEMNCKSCRLCYSVEIRLCRNCFHLPLRNGIELKTQVKIIRYILRKVPANAFLRNTFECSNCVKLYSVNYTEC